MPLPISRRMSVSRRALFTRIQPPRPFFPDLHSMLNGLVEQIGVIPKGTDQAEAEVVRVARRLGLRLRWAQLAEEQTHGLGHRVVDGSEPSGMDGLFHGAFELIRQIYRH